jgi:hypothetical protein
MKTNLKYGGALALRGKVDTTTSWSIMRRIHRTVGCFKQHSIKIRAWGVFMKGGFVRGDHISSQMDRNKVYTVKKEDTTPSYA